MLYLTVSQKSSSVNDDVDTIIRLSGSR